jgi:hypothetical protein
MRRLEKTNTSGPRRHAIYFDIDETTNKYLEADAKRQSRSKASMAKYIIREYYKQKYGGQNKGGNENV